MSRFGEACKHFGLTISLKKTQPMDQGISDPPEITISNHQLEVVHDFVYLGSTISDTLSLDTEHNRRIDKASTTMSRLTKRVWGNGKLTENTKIQVYRACVLSTLLHGFESWTLHAQYEHKLNTFYLRNLRRILNIIWQGKVPNTEVIERANLPSMYSLLKQRRLGWLGHVCRMEEGRIPKNILYGELAEGKRPVGIPQLRFKDICKRDLKSLNIDRNSWETLAKEKSAWTGAVKDGLVAFEETLTLNAEEKRRRKKMKQHEGHKDSTFICPTCGKDCHSRIALSSHSRRCFQRSIP